MSGKREFGSEALRRMRTIMTNRLQDEGNEKWAEFLCYSLLDQHVIKKLAPAGCSWDAAVTAGSAAATAVVSDECLQAEHGLEWLVSRCVEAGFFYYRQYAGRCVSTLVSVPSRSISCVTQAWRLCFIATVWFAIVRMIFGVSCRTAKVLGQGKAVATSTSCHDEGLDIAAQYRDRFEELQKGSDALAIWLLGRASAENAKNV